ncbi:hypothetical protein T492DRAFT_836725 [Pavlovales sp. CCMP2436]|nr:hypothetical protein T492DRAFT_836725 [Pavlovales sp. CCMP2436]
MRPDLFRASARTSLATGTAIHVLFSDFSLAEALAEMSARRDRKPTGGSTNRSDAANPSPHIELLLSSRSLKDEQLAGRSDSARARLGRPISTGGTGARVDPLVQAAARAHHTVDMLGQRIKRVAIESPRHGHAKHHGNGAKERGEGAMDEKTQREVKFILGVLRDRFSLRRQFTNLFRTLDLDKSGKIDKYEMGQYLHALSIPLDGGVLDRVMEELDPAAGTRHSVHGGRAWRVSTGDAQGGFPTHPLMVLLARAPRLRRYITLRFCNITNVTFRYEVTGTSRCIMERLYRYIALRRGRAGRVRRNARGRGDGIELSELVDNLLKLGQWGLHDPYMTDALRSNVLVASQRAAVHSHAELIKIHEAGGFLSPRII